MARTTASGATALLLVFLAFINLASAGLLSHHVVHGDKLKAAALLVARQNTDTTAGTATTANTVVSCASYSSIANLSTISSNSTYRAAFLRSSPDGVHFSAGLLNDAQALLPPLIFDETLNSQCGNSTAIAIQGAMDNFTQGIVAQFKIQEAVGIAPGGDTAIYTFITVMAIMFFMMGTFACL
jgi:hypothetical protein